MEFCHSILPQGDARLNICFCLIDCMRQYHSQLTGLCQLKSEEFSSIGLPAVRLISASHFLRSSPAVFRKDKRAVQALIFVSVNPSFNLIKKRTGIPEILCTHHLLPGLPSRSKMLWHVGFHIKVRFFHPTAR